MLYRKHQYFLLGKKERRYSFLVSGEPFLQECRTHSQRSCPRDALKEFKFEHVTKTFVSSTGSVADPGCLSQIPDPTFPIPDPRLKTVPDYRSASKNLSIFNPKNCF